MTIDFHAISLLRACVDALPPPTPPTQHSLSPRRELDQELSNVSSTLLCSDRKTRDSPPHTPPMDTIRLPVKMANEEIDMHSHDLFSCECGAHPSLITQLRRINDHTQM